MDELLWNILHDGSLVGLKGKTSRNITLEIKIEYLAKLFSKEFKTVLVELTDCSLFEYFQEYGSDGISDFEEIVKLKPWLTSGEINGNVLTIYCNDGFIETSYKKSNLFLENQTPISLQQLDEKSKIYWESFGT